MPSATITFQSLSFEEKNGKIAARLMKLFEFPIPKKELSKIGHFKINKDSITFENISKEKAEKKLSLLITKNITNLRNRLTGRKAVYIHKNSDIPLIGTLYFGIVDKGSDMIEVKPLTGCNLDCVFCSVSEGLYSKREADYIVEDDYIAEEIKKLLEFKNQDKDHKDMKIFINPHGEPLLYSNIIPLIEKISKLRQKTISIITNGTLLTEKLIDKLKKAGLTQINLSINTLNPEKSKQLSGLNSYNTERIKNLAEYASKKLSLILAPVWINGLNDNDIEEIIRFAKKLGCEVGIQKYIAHKKGKKPAKEIPWEEFYKKVDEWEKKYDINLKYCEETAKTKEMPMPFKRNDIVKARVACIGRKKNEVIAAARNRCILVFNCSKPAGKEIKVRIKTARHNVFTGEEI